MKKFTATIYTWDFQNILGNEGLDPKKDEETICADSLAEAIDKMKESFATTLFPVLIPKEYIDNSQVDLPDVIIKGHKEFVLVGKENAKIELVPNAENNAFVTNIISPKYGLIMTVGCELVEE